MEPQENTAPLISLSEEERERFATFLEQEATTEEGLVKQMDMAHLSGGIPKEVIRMYSTRALAKRVVAKDLRSVHGRD